MIKEATYVEFCECMEELRAAIDFYEGLARLGVQLDYVPLENTYVKNLQRLVNDKNGWISYYIYERDWGKEEGDCVFEHETGEPIPFKTLEDLWNLIQYTQSKKVY